MHLIPMLYYDVKDTVIQIQWQLYQGLVGFTAKKNKKKLVTECDFLHVCIGLPVVYEGDTVICYTKYYTENGRFL